MSTSEPAAGAESRPPDEIPAPPKAPQSPQAPLPAPGRASAHPGAGRSAGPRTDQEVAASLVAMANLHDLRREAQAEARCARQRAARDELTRLYDRNSFHERLEQGLAGDVFGPLQLAVLFVDIDDFRSINETQGPEVGDAALRIVAVRLSQSLRVDDVVGRLGGDEFACLVDDVKGRQPLARLAGRLFGAVAAPMRIGLVELSLRPSIGIAHAPADGTTAGGLLRRADLAMSRARRLGCGHAFSGRDATA